MSYYSLSQCSLLYRAYLIKSTYVISYLCFHFVLGAWMAGYMLD